jgi:hypothetical protein
MKPKIVRVPFARFGAACASSSVGTLARCCEERHHRLDSETHQAAPGLFVPVVAGRSRRHASMSEGRGGATRAQPADLVPSPCFGHAMADTAMRPRRNAHVFATALPGP